MLSRRKKYIFLTDMEFVITRTRQLDKGRLSAVWVPLWNRDRWRFLLVRIKLKI